MLPLGDAWNIYARLGYYFGDNELSGALNVQETRLGVPVGSPVSQRFSESDSSGVFLWGAGVSYTWNQRVSFRLEYDNVNDVVESSGPYGDDKTDVERFTLGVVYRFGDIEQPMAPMAAAAPVRQSRRQRRRSARTRTTTAFATRTTAARTRRQVTEWVRLAVPAT